jgi:hypothetical protein
MFIAFDNWEKSGVVGRQKSGGLSGWNEANGERGAGGGGMPGCVGISGCGMPGLKGAI